MVFFCSLQSLFPTRLFCIHISDISGAHTSGGARVYMIFSVKAGTEVSALVCTRVYVPLTLPSHIYALLPPPTKKHHGHTLQLLF